MGHIQTLDQVDDDDTRQLYDEIVDAGFGGERPINWFASQGLRPDILASTWGLTKTLLLEGRLPPTLRQMVLMVISAQNQCRYCTVTHTGALEQMGVPSTVLEACLEDPALADVPAPHRAVLLFALKAARDPNSIDAADHQVLRDNQLTDGEIVEVCMLAAFANFINTYADAAGIELDG